MIVLPQNVKVKWHPKHKNYYELKGYVYTKMADEFEVNVLDLKPGSRVEIKVVCEYCKKEVMLESKAYSERTRDSKYSCNNIKCINDKKRENTIRRHGYEHTSQIPEVKNKLFNTNIERYGNKCSLQGENVIEKTKETLMKRYHVDNPMKSIEIQEKTKQTNILRYGVPFLMQNEEIRKKALETMKELYGYEYALQNPEIFEKMKNTIFQRFGVTHIYLTEENKRKARESFRAKGLVPDSRQQKYIYSLIGIGCQYNYLIEKAGFIDIVDKNNSLCIEYDGGGHDLAVKMGKLSRKEFERNEMKRNYVLINNRWKIIRIISKKDWLPSDKMIIKLITDAKEYLNSGHSWYSIDIDDSLVRCSQFEKKVELGELRKIKKEDVL